MHLRVAWGGLGDLAMLAVAAPPKGPSIPLAVRNYAGPQHFCHYRGYDFAWVPGTVLGCPVREIGPSLPDRSWPYRTSVNPLYSVTPVTARGKCQENAEAMPTRDNESLLGVLKRQPAQQRIGQRTGGQRADSHRGGGGDSRSRGRRYAVT